MSALLKPFRVVRTHWKKSTFFAIAATYGSYYFHDKYQSNLIRRELCEEAMKYGAETMTVTEKPRKVLVILNPAAKKGKARKLFQANAAPILHLAGISTEIFETTYEGEAKDKMQTVNDVDAIIVAGGDGTLSEVVTGLMRRDEECKWPLGIIPIGKTNTLAKTLYVNAESDVRWMGGAALSIIQGWSKPMNVMKIEGEEGKTVYAMTGVQWGLYKDSQEKSTKYWYFGPLKQRISYIIKTMQGWPQFIRSDFSSTVPCTGCNKCVTAIPKKPSIWSWLFGWWRKTEEVIDYSQINNEECGIWNEMKISSVEFTASTTNTDPLLQGISEIKVDLGIEEMSRSDFIKEGWARMKDKNNKDTEERIERTKMSVGEFKLTPIIDKDQENWFYIDSEKFEVMSIHASLLKNKINFFTNIH